MANTFDPCTDPYPPPKDRNEHEFTPKLMRASAFLRVAERLRSFSSVNGVCLVPAGLLGDAAGYLELAAYEEGVSNASSSR